MLVVVWVKGMGEMEVVGKGEQEAGVEKGWEGRREKGLLEAAGWTGVGRKRGEKGEGDEERGKELKGR